MVEWLFSWKLLKSEEKIKWFGPLGDIARSSMTILLAYAAWESRKREVDILLTQAYDTCLWGSHYVPVLGCVFITIRLCLSFGI